MSELKASYITNVNGGPPDIPNDVTIDGSAHSLSMITTDSGATRDDSTSGYANNDRFIQTTDNYYYVVVDGLWRKIN